MLRKTCLHQRDLVSVQLVTKSYVYAMHVYRRMYVQFKFVAFDQVQVRSRYMRGTNGYLAKHHSLMLSSVKCI